MWFCRTPGTAISVYCPPGERCSRCPYTNVLTRRLAPAKIAPHSRLFRVIDTAVTEHELYLTHQAHIERALQVVCRRQALGAEAEDFCSAFRVHLLEDDCRILRVFQGRSSLDTYLVTVVTRYFQDWRNARWGKWRISAEARRLGPVAIQLEILLVRDRLSMNEAVEMLRTRHGVSDARAELEALAARLPQRHGRTLVSDECLEERAAASADADALVRLRDARAAAQRAQETLATVLASLPAQDRLILRLYGADELPIAGIARMLHIDQKPLYRRIERLKLTVRAALSQAGLSSAVVAEVIGAGGLEAGPEVSAENTLELVRPREESGQTPASPGRPR